jgi:hypothetical protein
MPVPFVGVWLSKLDSPKAEAGRRLCEGSEEAVRAL